MREAVSQLLQCTHIGILGAAFQVNVDNQDRARESRGGSGLGLQEGGLNEPRRNDFLLDGPNYAALNSGRQTLVCRRLTYCHQERGLPEDLVESTCIANMKNYS